jgi:acetyl-CoA C-acetyltransferase
MHANAVANPNAMFRKAVKPGAYAGAEPTNPPLNVYDTAPYADGAAAVILTTPDRAQAFPRPLVRISGSSVVIDRLALHDRPWLLGFEAVSHSLERACRTAGILPTDVDFLEISDTFSIFAPLVLEAAGFAPRGRAAQLAAEGIFNRDGRLPLNAMAAPRGAAIRWQQPGCTR